METNRKQLDLTGDWKIAWTENPPGKVYGIKDGVEKGLNFFDCTVPGCFETDLFKLGIVPEPFFGMNPYEVNRYTESRHVYYARKFCATKTEATEPYLVFEGIDCFAEVCLNGVSIAFLDNMLIEHCIDIGCHLKDGSNEIFIHILPAREEALKFEYPQLLDSLKVNFESIYVRKAAHMYGWDIMPRFISAGIYRPVYIEYKPAERFEELYLKTTDIADNNSAAKVVLHYKFKGRLTSVYKISIEMTCGDSVIAQEIIPQFIAGKHNMTVDSPKLWWPKGRGEAHLYDVTVKFIKDNVCIDSVCFRHGIRSIELVRTAVTTSAMEGEFVFRVNGEKVFIKGTNWVPVDAFHHRDKERIPAILDMANDLNCNMIRCWGGNVYEDELFYDICDESGILIWQDFGMACSIYPQDDEFADKLALEAEAVVKRLRKHACVALWSGDNECDWSYLWGYSKTDPNTNRLTRNILPEAIRLHDGIRPYIGSSPFFEKDAMDKDERFLTEMHLWGPRDYYKSGFYINSLCHFVSEIGYHGCPWPESIKKFISSDKIWPCINNEEWILHSTSPVPGVVTYDYRVELMQKQIAELFTEIPDSLDDFAFASQAVQAEAKKFFIELFRIAKWKRTGILWWNIMDGWPQFSDAIVDYYFNKKIAYYFVRNVQAEICIMLDEPESWNQRVIVSNDTRDDKVIRCEIMDVETKEIVFSGSFIAYADKSAVIGTIPYKRNRQRMFVIKWFGDVSGCNHYLAGQPPFELGFYKKLLKLTDIFGEI